jgi:hypothetical protein
MMAIVLAAASGYFAVPALWIVGRRFLDVERLPWRFHEKRPAALADARRRL